MKVLLFSQFSLDITDLKSCLASVIQHTTWPSGSQSAERFWYRIRHREKQLYKWEIYLTFSRGKIQNVHIWNFLTYFPVPSFWNKFIICAWPPVLTITILDMYLQRIHFNNSKICYHINCCLLTISITTDIHHCSTVMAFCPLKFYITNNFCRWADNTRHLASIDRNCSDCLGTYLFPNVITINCHCFSAFFAEE